MSAYKICCGKLTVVGELQTEFGKGHEDHMRRRSVDSGTVCFRDQEAPYDLGPHIRLSLLVCWMQPANSLCEMHFQTYTNHP